MICIHCDQPVEVDDNVKTYTGQTVYFNADVVEDSPEYTNTGRHCPDGEPHEVALTEADIAEEKLRSRNYEAWAAL